MNWLQLSVGFGLGILAVIGYEIYLNYKEDRDIDEELEQERDFIMNIIETILFVGIQYDDITTIVVPTETMGVLAVKIVFHREEDDVIEYAIVKGKEVFLVNMNQWAYMLGDEGVRAVPCSEDLDDLDDGYYEIDEEDED